MISPVRSALQDASGAGQTIVPSRLGVQVLSLACVGTPHKSSRESEIV
jgi:hypothetical protein